MSLIPKLRISAAQPTGMLLLDDTGNYDAVANPGGWGAPNPLKTDVIAILVSQVRLGKGQSPGGPLSVSDQAAYLTGTGAAILPATANQDGVYDVDALIGFTAPQTITSVAGQLTFLMTNANSVFALATGFTINGVSPTFFAVDRSQPLTNTGGSVLGALPAAAGATVTYYFDAQAYALVCQTGQACLLRDIAKYAGTCEGCSGDDLDALTTRYNQYLAMFIRFAAQDWAGADDLAAKLQKDCLLQGVCTPMGTTPSATLTGIAPVITVQPGDAAVSAGATVSFGVTATGTLPLLYQWRKNGVDIAGATGQTLLLLNISPADAALYSVIVYNQYGYDTSRSATLSIGSALNPIVITVQPISQATTIGANIALTVTATGSDPKTYQWRKNGTPINGATANTLNLNNIQPGDAANYDCVVSNAVNSVVSAAAAITLGIIARWGWSDAPPANTTDIGNGQGSGSFTPGATITGNYTANAAPKILWMAEPSTEPLKIKWFESINNNGNIGDPNNDLFGVPVIIGPWRVYSTIFPTAQQEAPINFLTS